MSAIRLQDIGDKLNISKVAVSKALRNHSDISDEMKLKVKEIAKQMGYLPNNLAKNLKAKKSFTIGVIVPNITNTYFSQIVTGIIESCAFENYTTIISISNENPELELKNIENLYSLRIDGLLICVTKNSDYLNLTKLIAQIKIPIVFFDRVPENLNFTSISSDQDMAAYSVVNFLFENGYRKFAFINGPEILDISKKRKHGFLTGIEEKNCTINKHWLRQCDLSKDSGEKECFEILKGTTIPEIIFCINDEVAYGAYKAIYKKGLKIPEEIGVLAFGHKEFADNLIPTLSIIEQFPNELGKKSVEILLNLINKKDEVQNRNISFQTKFIQGNSILIPKQ